MWQNWLDPVAIGCYLVPILLIILVCVLFVALPVLQVPSAETITRYARKHLKRNPYLSKGALRRMLKDRFVPAWAHDNPRERSEVTRGAMLIFCGILITVIIYLMSDVRNYFALNLIEARIDRVIDRLWAD